MPDWTGSFKMPHMTTEKFMAMKAKYIAKHGYTINIPGFEDIIHVPIEKTPSQEEEQIWKSGDYKKLAPGRYEEIKYIKKRRKEKFLAMLGSPTPEVFSNHSAVMASLDNAQDALATIVALGTVVTSQLPRAFAKALAGPLGWLSAGTEALDVMMEIQRSVMTPLSGKRWRDSMTELNPLSKKARLKRTDKLAKAKLKKGFMVEALQVTDNIFGFGLSLGALMGAPVEIIAGNVRMVGGAPVKVNYPIPDLGHWGRMARKFHSSQNLITPFYLHSDDDSYSQMLIGSVLAQQVIAGSATSWNPLEAIDNVDKVEYLAPAPTSVLTLECYEEEGIDPRASQNWPTLGKPWATLDEIVESSYDMANDCYRGYCNRNKHNWRGFVAATNAIEATLQTLENLEGPNSIQHDYTAANKVVHKLLYSKHGLPEDITTDQKTKYTAWLMAHEKSGSCPTMHEVHAYAYNECNFKFVRI